MSAFTNAQLTQLYRKGYPPVARYIARRGGSPDEAKDIFQDAFIVLYEKLAGGITLKGAQQAYLMGIAKHLWLKHQREQSQTAPLDAAANITDGDEPQSYAESKLLGYLETAGRRCLDLLKAFYYDRLTMPDVAEQFGYSSTHSATVQKYKCLEKVRDTVKQQSLCYEDFLE